MSNGTITMTGAEYDALADRIATLEAENAKLKGEYEWVASINTALDESNQSAWAENAKLRAELERRESGEWKLVPVEPTEQMANAYWDAYQKANDTHFMHCYRAILAAPRQPEGGIEPDITTKHGYPAYSVEQHQRAIAELRDELDAAKEILAQQGRRNTELREERDELAGLLRGARLKMGYMLNYGEWYSPEELLERISAALAEVNK